MHKFYMSLALLVVVPTATFTTAPAPVASVSTVIADKIAAEVQKDLAQVPAKALGVVEKVQALKNTTFALVAAHPYRAAAALVAAVIVIVVATKKKSETEQEMPF